MSSCSFYIDHSARLFFLDKNAVATRGVIQCVSSDTGHQYTLQSLETKAASSESSWLYGKKLLRLMLLCRKSSSMSLQSDLIQNRDFKLWSKHVLSGVVPSEERSCKWQRALAKASYISHGLARIAPMGKMMVSKYWSEVYTPGHPSGAEMQDFLEAWKFSKKSESFEEWFSRIKEGVRPHSVRYLDDEQRKDYEVSFCDGKLIQHGAPLCTDRIDSDKASGAAIYVLTPEHKMYVGPYLINRFQHSSFYSGKPIIGAGEIITDTEGKITFLSNRSGHYQPQEKQLLDVLAFLKEQSIDLTDVLLAENTSFSITRHSSAGNFFEQRTPTASPLHRIGSPIEGTSPHFHGAGGPRLPSVDEDAALALFAEKIENAPPG